MPETPKGSSIRKAGASCWPGIESRIGRHLRLELAGGDFDLAVLAGGFWLVDRLVAGARRARSSCSTKTKTASPLTLAACCRKASRAMSGEPGSPPA